MLVQYCWLSSLPFIASAIAHAYPPAGLRPRYLATGTGISLPSTSAAPYPTGTAIPTGSITPTAAPTSIPSSELLYLVIADTGTEYDGEYLGVNSQYSGTGLLVLYPRKNVNRDPPFSVFNINADGTLQNEFSGGIANIFPGSTDGTLHFEDVAYVEEVGNIKTICDVVGGTLNCQTGADTVFFICPFRREAATQLDGTLNVGRTVQPGCTPITVLVVPV